MSDLCQLLYGDRFRMMFLYISENRPKCFGHPGFCRNRVFGAESRSMPADKISEAVRFSATDQTLQDFCVHTA